MGLISKQAKQVLGGLALSLMLAGWAIGQDGPAFRQPGFFERLAPTPTVTSTTSPTPVDVGACQSCQGCCAGQLTCPPPPGMIASPACWPPPCDGLPCEGCESLKSQCPTRNDFFIVPPRLRFYAIADGAAIRRSDTRAIDFASFPGNRQVVLSTGDFDTDFTGAGHFLVGYTINECYQIEGVYTGVSQADNMASARDNTPNTLRGRGDLMSPFSNFGYPPMTGLDFNNLAEIRLASSLNSAEVYIRRKVPMPPDRLAVSILFGARYIGMPETFDYFTQSAVPLPGGNTNTIHVETDNQMVGPEIGSLLELYVDNRWWINFEAKAAVMNNRSRHTTDYTNVDPTGTTSFFTGTERESHTAFAESLDLTFIYRWSPRFNTRLGYQALFLQEMVLAPNNFDTDINNVIQGPTQLNHRGTTIFHGPYAGITFGW